MVGRRVLAPVMGVRALLPQPLTVDWAAPSSRGLGHGPLKAETRVRIPLGPPLQSGALKSNEFPSPQSVRQYTSRVPSKGGAFRWERDGNSGTSAHATPGEACADRPGQCPNHEPSLRSRDLSRRAEDLC